MFSFSLEKSIPRSYYMSFVHLLLSAALQLLFHCMFQAFNEALCLQSLQGDSW